MARQATGSGVVLLTGMAKAGCPHRQRLTSSLLLRGDDTAQYQRRVTGRNLALHYALDSTQRPYQHWTSSLAYLGSHQVELLRVVGERLAQRSREIALVVAVNMYG